LARIAIPRSVACSMVLKALIDYCGITFPVVFVMVFNEVNESLASVVDGFAKRFHVMFKAVEG